MHCPKCWHEDVTPVGLSHYVCNNPDCNTNGARTQFSVVTDEKVEFPYNQIFANRKHSEFFKVKYLDIKPVVNKKR